MRKILYCPSCKVEDSNFEISMKDFSKIHTSTYIGDSIVPYVICPHCKYILAGTRDARDSKERNEATLFLLKDYVDKDGAYVQGSIYEDLMNKALKKISDRISEYRKEIVRLKDVKIFLD